MKAPTTTVVVCGYTLDRWDDLQAAVVGAASQSPAPDEVYLIIDHNAELLGRAQRELVARVPTLRVLPNNRKQGLSGARNTALDHVRSDIVVFLDDDATPEAGWFACLIEPYADSGVIAVGGAATPCWPAEATRPITLPANRSGPLPRGELDWVVGCTYAGQPDSLSAVRNLMGCNMSFRTEVFARVGGFSENLGRVGKTPLGCEETELCIRASRAFPGARILFEPRALVRHHVSPDRLTWRYLRRRCFAEGVSKAAVANMAGTDQALQDERSYVREVLPSGFWRELTGWRTSGRQPRSPGSAFAIVLGLGATATGYPRGKVSSQRKMVDLGADAPTVVAGQYAADVDG